MIPNSVTYIGESAFLNCNNLSTVYYTGTEKEWKRKLSRNIHDNNDSLLNAEIVFNYSLSLSGAMQGNWSQNDKNSCDYIQNRTHWINGFKEVVLLEETSVEISGTYGDLPTSIEIIEGNTYKVIFNNTEYKCIAWYMPDFDDVYIGTGSMWGVDAGNNEPFVTNGSWILLDSAADNVNIKISILEEDIHKLDKKFLPEGVVLKEDIPDISNYITTHNTSIASHNDIRDLITGLTNRLNALADSDDTTLDQLSEIVTYIKSNKELIDAITTSKVNVDDIVNNLTTNVSNKPLSAAQGVALKSLIDAITVPTKVSELTNDSGYLTSYTETDPTVPAWAKAASKPTYTATEVGADASGTANSVVSTHNTSTESHPDIREALANKVNQGDITLSSFGITATAAELNYVDGVTSNIQTQLTNKAPKNHASTATTYGASSASNYGHAMASSTTPKANGAAAVGSETAKFARGDHIHPAQTEITGNAGSATKLQTARTINGIAFDGTADIVVPSSVKIGIITLTANGWVEDATLGAFKQTAAIPNLANGHKVDLDADLNTINQLPASIVPYNDNGTFYAVTLTPPSVDIAVQYTLLATN